jgi:ribosomal protein S18 acetylase RimI-like enzyme
VLYCFTFSTWKSVNGLHLEDLYVEPESRRHGVGRRLMGELVDIARNHHCGRFDWFVLKSNAGARRFYESIAAEALDEWTFMHLTVEPSRSVSPLESERDHRARRFHSDAIGTPE